MLVCCLTAVIRVDGRVIEVAASSQTEAPKEESTESAESAKVADEETKPDPRIGLYAKEVYDDNGYGYEYGNGGPIGYNQAFYLTVPGKGDLKSFKTLLWSIRIPFVVQQNLISNDEMSIVFLIIIWLQLRTAQIAIQLTAADFRVRTAVRLPFTECMEPVSLTRT